MENAIVHGGVEYTPFVAIYRRADATSGRYTGRKPDHFVALFVDPDCPYEGLSGVASETYIALAKLEDAQSGEALQFIIGSNGTEINQAAERPQAERGNGGGA